MNQNKTLLDVEKEYRQSIKIPKTKPGKQFFFCPVGLIGAGKTPVTKAMSERFNLLRVSSDELRKILKENGYNYDSVKEIGYKIVKEFASSGYSIALDMDCGSLEAISLIKNLSEEFHAKVVWVHINPPEEFIFSKFRNYNHTWLFKNAEDAIQNYLAQKAKRLKENSKFDFLYTFDASKGDIEQQIKECSEKIESFINSK